MRVDLEGLTAELLDLARSRRVLVGICGAPGAGKSTLANQLVDAANATSPGVAVAVGMDGFHLAKSVIAADERRDRRGAPDTFDPAGYASLLARLRTAAEPVVYAPEYRREIEDPVNAAVPVPRTTRLIVTEGNYLLHPEWEAARAQLDMVWYLEAPDESVRVEQLIARHVRYGKSPDHARTHVLISDEANAALVKERRDLADRLLRWPKWTSQ